MKLLDQINSREDLLRVPPEREAQLCSEIRQYLVDCVAQNGGHLSSNLGIVELTLAIEKEFDTSRDRLVFDVGHQSYVHKLLTGRREKLRTMAWRAFPSLRKVIAMPLQRVTPPVRSPLPLAWPEPERFKTRIIM